MAFLTKSNMITGHIIPASDVYQIVDAFTYSGSYDLLISGSISIGTNSIQSNAKVYIKQNLKVDGGITGSVSGSFTGNGAGLTNIISASYAGTASHALNTAGGVSNTTFNSYTSSLNSFTSSYYDASESFSTRINNVFASESKYVLTSSYLIASSSFDARIDNLTPYKIYTGSVNSVQVATYPNGRVIVSSGSSDMGAQFIVSGSGSFTGAVQAPSFYQTSLRVLKENIHPFSASAVELINELNVVTFNYKKHQSLFKIGIIADDTHEYISTRDHNSLDATNSIGLLFKAVQELYKLWQNCKCHGKCARCCNDSI